MKTTLHVCLLAGAMALCLAKAAASPLTGMWVGEDHGVKAVELEIDGAGATVQVHATFYIVEDEGSGEHVGQASETPSASGKWDGKKLAFTVINTAGDRIAFEMTPDGDGRAKLRRLASNGMPELRTTLRRK